MSQRNQLREDIAESKEPDAQDPSPDDSRKPGEVRFRRPTKQELNHAERGPQDSPVIRAMRRDCTD